MSTWTGTHAPGVGRVPMPTLEALEAARKGFRWMLLTYPEGLDRINPNPPELNRDPDMSNYEEWEAYLYRPFNMGFGERCVAGQAIGSWVDHEHKAGMPWKYHGYNVLLALVTGDPMSNDQFWAIEHGFCPGVNYSTHALEIAWEFLLASYRLLPEATRVADMLADLDLIDHTDLEGT